MTKQRMMATNGIRSCTLIPVIPASYLKGGAGMVAGAGAGGYGAAAGGYGALMYHAMVEAVDLESCRVKIHYTRWPRAFDRYLALVPRLLSIY
jgi:hypothetical protein